MTTLGNLRLALILVGAVGCVDSKDSGDSGTDGGTGGGGDDVRSIDVGDCPESGLAGASELPLVTARHANGPFIMGTTDDPDASPEHDVSLTRRFLMSVTEVTQGQWTSLGFPNPSQNNTCADCPVEQVTWHEAAAFADALSTSDGLATCYVCSGEGADTECTAPTDPYACEGWRLPTEAEWESAAAVDSTTFAGNDAFELVAWTAEAVGRPCPVGALQPTSLGVYDLSGNVSEWVHDGYAAYSSEAQTDPVGDNSAAERVVRGGSIFEVADRAVVTARVGEDGTQVVPWRGFRLVRTVN